jgi:hypothetical protein
MHEFIPSKGEKFRQEIECAQIMATSYEIVES